MNKRYLWLGLLLAALAVLCVYRTAKRNEAALQAMQYTADASTIIVDAGHGGFDGGTVAADGTVEKDLNLQIAQKLELLLRTAGIRVVMTRVDDQALHDPQVSGIRKQKISDIHNRLKIMNETDNALFVSIHQNHFTQSKYHGTQVFYSGNHPQSAVLAQSIQTAVTQQLQPDNGREIKQSGTEIYLLYHAACPAVMVECGFLSNPQETEQLKTDVYQTQIALTIYNGLWNFMEHTEAA